MYGTDIDGFAPPGGVLSRCHAATGRMNRDVILPISGDLDSSADVSGRGSMDLMSKAARYNPKCMCRADFDGFAPPAGCSHPPVEGEA